MINNEDFYSLMILAFLAGRGESGATEEEMEHMIPYLVGLYYATEDKDSLIGLKDIPQGLGGLEI